MSVLDTGQRRTSELAASLEWPGVNLSGCELLAYGSITSIDKPNNTLEYERTKEELDGVKRWAIGIFSLMGVEFHPPENGAPLDTRQNFWYFLDPDTYKMAVLRDISVY